MPKGDELIEILLKNRNIKKEDWDKFLNPSYENDIYDPYQLKDMDIAVSRIYNAISNNEKIVVYTDYDADGIPAGVIMHDFFNKIGFKNFQIYIPHRHDEGYGLHEDAIEEFIKDKINLLITFDLGITAVEEVEIAKRGDIDVIVVDHHLPKEDENGNQLLPKALAVIDPKRNDCEYKDKMLCGAGLSYKLALALISKYKDEWGISKGWEKWLLDMAGVATIADQVPLLDENRVLAKYGLLVLKKTKRQGLLELFKKAKIEMKDITEEDISFTLAPRINVASRMADPMIAFELLSETNPVKAKALADELDKINNERKISVAHIMKEVKSVLSKRFENEEYQSLPLIVIGNPKWHVGVLGIIASKVVDEYKKTAFIWGGDGDDIRGSCRGNGDVNLVQVMASLPEGSFTNFGGHKNAGGFSVSREEIHFLEEKLHSVFGDHLNGDLKEEEMFIDARINIDDVNKENYKVIERLAPYGEGNPKPTFLLENAEIYSVKEFGKEKNHLEIGFKGSKGGVVKAIAFFKTRNDFKNKKIEEGEKIKMIVNFEKNSFLGKEEIRLRIVDLPR